MLQSFIYVGREALEMMFLTLMVVTAIKASKSVVTSALVGIASGVVVGFTLGELLEDYEVLMYGLLSALMLYLFINSADLHKHIKSHVDDIANSATTAWTGLFTVWFIYFRESTEIFTFMFQQVNNTVMGWTGAVLAAATVAVAYKFLVRYKETKMLFNVTRYAFLVFALWFGYEALEHAHIL